MKDDQGEFATTLELCRNEHRRIILAALLRDRRALTLNDLTKEVVRHNHPTSITDVPSEDVNQIHLSLYHQHVPKLLDAKVVTYDRARELIEPTERFGRLQPYLSTIIDADPDLEISDAD